MQEKKKDQIEARFAERVENEYFENKMLKRNLIILRNGYLES